MTANAELSAYWDDVFTRHEPPAGAFQRESSDLLAEDEPHPDRALRVKNIRRIIQETLAEYTSWEPVSPATRDQLTRVHDPAYVDRLRAFCEDGGGRLTAFTGANEHTSDAAEAAAGAAIQAAERAVEGDVGQLPYALVRPSGHHAQPAQEDGYCYLNNVAVAAEHLLATGRVDRVAIVDWDVHHGNGTQEVFYDRDDVLFVSLHADHRSWGEWHPQTGLPEEIGTGAGEGYNVNVPLPHGAGDESYAYAFEVLVAPIVESFGPDAILVSAGQDPGLLDPMARMTVTKDGFRTLGSRIRDLASEHADGSLGLVQEGGYQPSHLAFATLGVLEGALDVETDVDRDPFALWSEENLGDAVEYVHDAGRVAAEHWPVPFSADPRAE